MTVKKITENLYQIDLDQTLTGFSNFINAWLYKSDTLTFLVDPGPKSSIETLIQALKELGVVKLDYILLTHIHIDHAGGTGRLIDCYPDAKVLCHPKGIPHMVEPDKLWQGSLKVLGAIAEAYGEILPVPETSFLSVDKIDTEEGPLSVIETPGHAVHHQSYLYKKILFAGEVAGFVHKLSDKFYKRPATPPKFRLAVSIDSLEKVRGLEIERVCVGHYGTFLNADQLLEEATQQLTLWVNVIKDEFKRGEEDLIDRAIAVLLEKDALFAPYKNLDSDLLERESYFLGNSIKGILEYIKSNQL